MSSLHEELDTFLPRVRELMDNFEILLEENERMKTLLKLHGVERIK